MPPPASLPVPGVQRSHQCVLLPRLGRAGNVGTAATFNGESAEAAC